MSPRLERHAAAMRRKNAAPDPPTAYQQGFMDGKRQYNRPSRPYKTSDALLEWFRGWQDGRHKAEPQRKAPVSAIEPWQARRRAYLRAKAAARQEIDTIAGEQFEIGREEAVS